MAISYYDDVIIKKLQCWLPEAAKIRVLRPDETSKLFSITADDLKDNAFTLPMLALSRKPDLELLSTVKSQKSFNGLKIPQTIQAGLIPNKTAQFNVLPIRPEYQLDIYTKTAEEAEEYVRALLFKLINNPSIIIEIPYHNLNIEHIANIRVLSNISDTSAISERIFSGQFTRWTIPFELHDAFLFSIPYRKNWILKVDPDIEGSDRLDIPKSKLVLTDDVEIDTEEQEDLEPFLTQL